MAQADDHFRDIDSKWSWVVMVASFVSLFNTGGLSYSVGLIHNMLLKKFGESQVNTAVVGALHSSISNIAAPISSLIVERFSVRTSIILGGVLYTVGYLGTAFSPSLSVTIFTCGIIAGLGGCVSWTSCMVACSFYFRKYRNFAQGFAMSGVGAGMFGIPPLVTWAESYYGPFGFFVAISCFSIQNIVCGVVIRPSDLEIYAQKKRRDTHFGKDKKGQGIFKNFYDTLKSTVVICLSLSFLFNCCCLYIVMVYLPNYATEQGFTKMQSSFVLSVCGVAAIVGRVCTGIVATFKPGIELALFSGSLLLQTVLLITFPLYDTDYTGHIVFGLLFGVFFSCAYVLIAPINLFYLGVERFTTGLGLELCACGVGGILGPIFGGLLVDTGASFKSVFVLAGICSFLAAVFGLLIPCLEKFCGVNMMITHEDKVTEVVLEQPAEDLPLTTPS